MVQMALGFHSFTSSHGIGTVVTEPLPHKSLGTSRFDPLMLPEMSLLCASSQGRVSFWPQVKHHTLS